MVYTIFCFSGFESVAPLAEESKNPKRNLPRAIVGSVLIIGAAYVICSWGLLAGWGTEPATLKQFIDIPDTAENPLFQLARRLWGPGWIVILLVLVNSAIGVSMASTNAATRVFFAMGRSGSLPKVLARVHPTHKTPFVAIALQTVLTFAIGLGLGIRDGPGRRVLLPGHGTDAGNGFRLLRGQSGRLSILLPPGSQRVQRLSPSPAAGGILGGHDLCCLQDSRSLA